MAGRGQLVNSTSSMEKELQSRFAHFLQPVRDLTKNWDVDVASQLEEHLTEVRRTTWTRPLMAVLMMSRGRFYYHQLLV